MENWKIYREDEIPKDVYIGDISYVEDNNPVIKLENWHNGRIINYIKLKFIKDCKKRLKFIKAGYHRFRQNLVAYCWHR